MPKKSARIDLRVTPDEKAAIGKLAAAAGLTVAEFLLSVALGQKIGDVILSKQQK